MIIGPKLECRAAQPTLGVRTQVPMPMDANSKFLDWGAKLKDPMNEPDPAKCETEVAIRLANGA